MIGLEGTYSLADTLLSVCTSRRSSLRVVWSESLILPAVSPLACFEAAMLKGRAARVGVELRMEVVAARQERARKEDMIVWFVIRLGLRQNNDVDVC
jgi:hypothetical protein